jgi:hypothetical protein
MKKFELRDEDNTYTLYIGSAQEIKALYRAMRKAWDRHVSRLCYPFYDFPKFNYDRHYGLFIEDGPMNFQVVSNDTALSMIADI